MNAKLTLSLDKKVVEQAKTFARQHQKSLSQMVEGYFQVVTLGKKQHSQELPQLVKELSGIISLPKKYNKRTLRKEYTEYLWKKYQ